MECCQHVVGCFSKKYRFRLLSALQVQRYNYIACMLLSNKLEWGTLEGVVFSQIFSQIDITVINDLSLFRKILV